jgi:hypothetical protein
MLLSQATKPLTSLVRDVLAPVVATRTLLMLVGLAGPPLLQLPPNPYGWTGSSQAWVNALSRWPRLLLRSPA